MKKLLVANRGEIAVRILHAAAELGIRSVAVFSQDDALSLHARRADEAHPLGAAGVAAYLDVERIVAIAQSSGCDALHPGYGFSSESAHLAWRCAAAGIAFVGPRPETLELLGDKVRARALAESCGVPVLEGSAAPVTLAQAQEFFAALGPGGAMMIKAVAGGGGRGLRAVRRAEEVEQAYARCGSEALRAFGNGEVYVERLLPRARHVEVQILGDGSGSVIHLGERDCSVQRRHQKLVEIAPSPSLAPALRELLCADAVRLAEALSYRNAGTFEFLVAAAAPAGSGDTLGDADAEVVGEGEGGDASRSRGDGTGSGPGDGARGDRGDAGEAVSYVFIEANPRLQVEHTVTEEVLGLDLVRIQLELARGRSLGELGLAQADVPAPRGFAIQMRINAETLDADGTVRPAAGALTAFGPPSGPGVRTDTCAHVGYQIGSSFDPLLAKLIARSPSSRFADTVSRARRALGELEIEGVPTNAGFLERLLAHPDFAAGRIDTRFVEQHAAELAAPGGAPASPRSGTSSGARSSAGGPGEVRAAMQGTIIAIEVQPGDDVRPGQPLLVMSAMKMEHVIAAPLAGAVRRIAVAEGDTVAEGAILAVIEPREAAAEPAGTTGTAGPVEVERDLERVRADLAEVQRRQALTRDAARPDAVARRRKTGQRTTRENLADLCDPGSFVEYGSLAIAAQRQRRSLEDLIERTPADGMIAGVGSVNGDLFDEAAARCAVVAYDYTVLAGTQGALNHRKKDRLFELAERLRLPVVLLAEGGGGRPGDVDVPGVAGLDCMAFHLFGRLSGLVPLIGVVSGRCFAGNAALLGCCDVVIATTGSNIGMGGPAMIEGGGLGVFRPEDVGPMSVQVPGGVVDVAVADEAQAVRAAKQYLSYFQGSVARWECADQRLLRAVIPENRLRVYEVRSAIEVLADTGSVLELRRDFAPGMVTALARIEGRPLGLIANDPRHLAGAIDAAGADKAARFMQLCDAFDLPILFLCDTPGIMVGPEAERTALVRHACRMFVVGASLTVPYCTIVLRKAYGLGAQAMAGGSHKAPLLTVSWPTGELGGMGLEGAVKLGFRKELDAVEDPEERRQLFEHIVARAYERGQALNTASHFEIDDVIDPAESRQRVLAALRATPAPAPRAGKKRPCVDTW